MKKEEALKVWLHEFGDVDYAHDFTGRKVKRDDYLVENQVGWVVTYMRPLNQGGTPDEGNTIILHHHTAFEKGDSYPEFYVDSIKYVVKHEVEQPVKNKIEKITGKGVKFYKNPKRETDLWDEKYLKSIILTWRER